MFHISGTIDCMYINTYRSEIYSAGNSMKKNLVQTILTASVMFALSACGGGGSGSSDTPPAPVPPPASTSISISGTAATGLAIAGATVNGKCQSGTGTATSGADGSFSMSIASGQFPCLLEITNPVNGTKLHAVIGSTGTSAIANITPLTELLTARVLGAEPSVSFAAFNAATMTPKLSTAALQQGQSDIALVLKGVVDLAQLGDFVSGKLIAATQSEPAAGNAHDKLLDALNEQLSSAHIAMLVPTLASNQTTDAIHNTIVNLVAEAALPPVARVSAEQSVLVGTTVDIDAGQSSAMAGRTLAFAWTLQSKPAGSAATLSNATSAKASFVADVAGHYLASMVVNDGKRDSGAATVAITASVANAAPIAHAGVAQSVLINSVTTLNGTGSSDANGDALRYVWTLTSRPATSVAVLSGTTTAKPTFKADVAGVYIASLTVNDGTVDSAPVTTSITVVNPIVLTDFAASNDKGFSIAVQKDGKIVLAGETENRGYRDFALVRYNIDGNLDTSFGNSGKVTTDVSAIDSAKSVTIQADGKILLAGSTTSSPEVASDFLLVRYNSDGSLDTTFGTGGKVVTSFGGGASASPVGVAQMTNGRIVVGGSNYQGFLAARYLENGNLDATFGSGGKVFKATSPALYANDMVVSADGAIVIVGSDRVARFLANGAPDEQFGNAGIAYARFNIDTNGQPYLGSMSTDTAGAVTIDAAGRVVVAAGSDFNAGAGIVGRVALARYQTNGSLDTSFGRNGVALTAFPTVLSLRVAIHDMVIQPDGKILVVGNTTQQNGSYHYEQVLLRYNTDGTLDATFGVDGVIIPAVQSQAKSAMMYGVKLLANGKILLSGEYFNGSNMDFSLLFYNADGSPSTSFAKP